LRAISLAARRWENADWWSPWCKGTACPIHYIMRELMPLEQFFYALHDYPEKVHRLAEQIAPFFQQTQTIGAESPAEVLMLGGNYDDSITYPLFFERYFSLPCAITPRRCTGGANT